MGTRCLTVFKESNGKEIVVMLRQFDGYPEGHGAELAEFLKGRAIINGIGSDEQNDFNGMGCLAASVVAKFKDRCGGFYLYPAKTRDCGEDYIYTISPGTQDLRVKQHPSGRNGTKEFWPIMLKVEESGGEVLYDGPADQFDARAVAEACAPCLKSFK